MAENLRVIAVEDHPLYRQAVTSLVEGPSGWSVVGSFGDAESAPDVVGSADVVVLDLGLPGMDGIAAIPSIMEVNPSARVVVLTMSEEPSARRCDPRGRAWLRGQRRRAHRPPASPVAKSRCSTSSRPACPTRRLPKHSLSPRRPRATTSRAS